jgi:hypothetical protein
MVGTSSNAPPPSAASASAVVSAAADGRGDAETCERPTSSVAPQTAWRPSEIVMGH